MGARINFTDEQKEEIIRLYTEENLGTGRIGKIFGCSKPTINKRLREWNISIKTANKDVYKPGMRIGPYNILLIEKINDYVSKNGIKQKNCYGKFLCPNHSKDDPHYFISQLIAVKNGHTTQCRECTTKLNREKLAPFQKALRVDLTGQRSGKLTILELVENEHGADGSCVWLCKCDCGNYCKVSSTHLRSHHTQSCGCLVSKGEQKISNILTEQNIKYKKQYTLEGCINPETNTKLKFDFYLPDYDCFIEYDGEQHFFARGVGWSTEECLQKVKKLDSLKNNYCINHNLKLIRIPYTDYNILNWEYLKEKIV